MDLAHRLRSLAHRIEMGADTKTVEAELKVLLAEAELKALLAELSQNG